MAGMNVDLGEMRLAQSRIGNIADQLENDIHKLERRASELLDNWRGHTAERYREDWDEWHRGAKEVVSALHEMAEALGSDSRAYENTEQSNASSIGTTSSGLHLNLDVD